MEQKRVKVRLTENSPYSDYGYYEKGDIGYIDGYVNDNAVIILENGKFVKADLRWIEVVNEEDKNVNTELAESEDERIRKSIIELLNEVHFTFKYYDINKMLAWLEKQGEQKPTDKIEPKFKVGNKIKLAIEPKYPAREIIAIQNDAYYFDEAVHLPFSRQDEWELVEQKPAWNEEDEKFVHGLIRGLAAKRDIHGHTTFSSDCIDITETINWLKSLKDRYTWKPTNE